MAKKKLEISATKADDDLNFDFDFDVDGALDQESKKTDDRSPLKKVTTGVMQGVRDTLTDPSFVAETIRKSLPTTYGELYDEADRTRQGLGELYDDAVKELRPRIGKIAEQFEKLIPEERKGLQGAIRKLKEFAKIQSEEYRTNVEDAVEQTVSTTVGEVFRAQQSQQEIEERIRVKRKALEDTMTATRHEDNMNVLSDIRKDISSQTQYTLNITQAYQKKMLELSVRSYLTQAESLKTNKRYFELFRTQLEGVVKNTSLPEFVKITSLEQFREIGLGKFFSGAQEKMFGKGSAVQNFVANLKEKGAELTRGVGFALDNFEMALESASSVKEQIQMLNEAQVALGLPPLSKAEMAAAHATSAGLNALRDIVTKRIRARAEKNPKLVAKLARGARFVKNLSGEVQDFRNSDRWQNRLSNYDGASGDFARLADAGLELFSDQKTNQRQESGTRLGELSAPTMGFDKKSHLSLTEIIPGHLAAIRQQVTIFNTKDHNTPLVMYDFERGQFVDKKVLSQRVRQSLNEEVDRSGMTFAVDRSVQNLTEGTQLSETQMREIKTLMSRIARIENFNPTKENIQSTSAYQKLSKKTQAALDQIFEKKFDTGDIGQQETNKKLFSDDYQNIKRSVPTLNRLVESFIRAGYGDILEEQGIWKRSSDGSFVVDEEAFGKFLDQQVARPSVRSDINVKDSIKKLNPLQLLSSVKEKMKDPKLEDYQRLLAQKWNPQKSFEGLTKTPLFRWKYRQGVGSQETHFGPMAQDVQKNLGNEAAPDGKSLDLQSINGAMVAALQHLGGKFDNLRDKLMGKKASPELDDALSENTSRLKSSNHYLALIQKDISYIRKNQGKFGHVGPGSPGTVPGEENDGSYSNMVAGVARQVTEIGVKLAKDTMGGVGSLLSFGKTSIVDPVQTLLSDNKEKLKEDFQKILSKGLELTASGMSFVNRMFTETLPAKARWIKDQAKWLAKETLEAFREARDLYIPGSIEPAIRAIKLKAGHYRDQVTGEVLLTLDEVLECKNNIVNELGQVVVTAEDRMRGFFDQEGQRVLTYGKSIAKLGIGAAVWLKNKAVDGFNKIKDLAKEHGSEAWDYLKDRTGKMTSKVKTSIAGFEGFGLIWKESHQVLVDIRDILLGEAKRVRRRLKMGTSADSSSTLPTEGASDTGVVGSSGSSLPDMSDLSSGPMGSVATAGNAVGSGTGAAIGTLTGIGSFLKDNVPGMATGVRDRYQRMRDRFKKPEVVGPPLPELEGPTRPGSRWGGLLTRAKGLGGRAMSVGGGLLSRGFGALGTLGNLASSLLPSGDNTTQPAPQTPTSPTPQAPSLPDYQNLVAQKWRQPKQVVLKPNERAFNDRDGDGKREGSVEERHERLEMLRQARKKEAAQADLTKRYGEGGGLFNGLMGKLGSIFSMITGGLGSLFSLGSGLIGKLAGLKGVGTLLGKGKGMLTGAATGIKGLLGMKAAGAVGTAATAAAGSTAAAGGAAGAAAGATAAVAKQGLLRTIMTIGGKGLWGMTKFAAGKLVPMIAGTAMSVLGSLGSAIVGIIGSPVVLTVAAVAAVGAGIWALYRWRQNKKLEPYDRIRFAQYGFPNKEPFSQHHDKLGKLEAYLEDNRLTFEGGVVSLNSKTVKAEEMLELFGIDPKDDEMVMNFMKWFGRRFKPFFLNHQMLIYGLDKKTTATSSSKMGFTTFNDWDQNKLLSYLEKASLDSLPYDELSSPIKSIDQLDGDRSMVKAMIDAQMAEVKKTATPEKSDKKPTLPKKDLSQPTDNLKTKEENRQKLEALAKANPALSKSDQATQKQLEQQLTDSEDGAKTSSPTVASSAPGTRAIPMADGDPLLNHTGRQFLRLGKGVDFDNLHPRLKSHMLGMAQEYGEKTGKSIQINSGYRSYEDQAALHRQDPKKAAKPGRSLHEKGLAVDIQTENANELEKLGLMKKYGFTRPVGRESWHLEPAGIQTNLKLARENEEEADRMIALSLGRGGGGVGTLTNVPKYLRDHGIAMAALHATPTKAPDVKTEVAQKLEAGTQKTPSSNDDQYQASSKPTSTPQEAVEEKTKVGAMTASSDTLSQSSKIPRLPDIPVPDDVEPTGGTSTATSTSVKASGDVSQTAKEVKEEIKKYAKEAGIDPSMAQTFAAVESDFRVNARASGPGQTAQGPFGFIRTTWREQMGKHASKYGLPNDASPSDVKASTLMFSEYLKSNLNFLKSTKPNPNLTDAYLTHFLGAGGARKFLNADGNSIGAEILPDAAKNNKAIFYQNGKALTVSQIYQRLSQKLSDKANYYGISIPKEIAPGEWTGKANTPTSTSTSASVFQFPTKETGTAEQKLPEPKPNVRPTTPSTSDSAPGRGFDFMDRSASPFEKQGLQSTAPAAINPKAMDDMVAHLAKSVGIQENMLSVLKNIHDKVDLEKALKAIAGAMQKQSESGKSDDLNVSPSQKDRQTRTATRTVEPGLNLQRRSS